MWNHVVQLDTQKAIKFINPDLQNHTLYDSKFNLSLQN